MNLDDLLQGIIKDSKSFEIKGLSSDSKKIEHDDLFFAISGNASNGADYAKEAVSNGASAVISDSEIEGLSVPCYKVDNIREVVSKVASRFYDNQLKNIVAVTGTNGKTSTAMFAMQMFDALEEKSSSIGTLGVMDKSGLIMPTNVTTPDAILVHKILQDLSEKEYTSTAIEASSHALEQNRLDNVKIKAAGFTNLTRDHIDYHKTMQSYGNAKKRLFYEVLPQDGIAVLNTDSEFFEELKDCDRTIIGYGRNSKMLRLESSEIVPTGQLVKLSAFGDTYDFVLNLSGEFQIMNALCAAGLLIGCGYSADKVIPIMSSLKAPAGRMELACETENGAKIFVDYAHTPDALETALKSLRPFTGSKLQVLFGCGGDRDPGKRQMMGEIAEKYADKVFVTDDNPRSEEPESIRIEVLKGAKTKGQNAGDRKSAMEYAIPQLKEGDVLLIAGKGHEDYQEIKGVKHPFDDKQIAIEIAESLKK